MNAGKVTNLYSKDDFLLMHVHEENRVVFRVMMKIFRAQKAHLKCV